MKTVIDHTRENTKLEVIFIIDRSGSMNGLELDTIGGSNAALKERKQEGDNIIWSTVLFDHEQLVLHDRLPIDQVPELTEREYQVRGSTALLDAIGRSLRHIGNVHKYARPEDVPQKTLVIITTDGLENASREFSYQQVRSMIERQQEKYGWEFLFLGANMDAVSVAGRMGIRSDRSATFLNDGAGIRENYGAISRAMGCMVREGSADLDEILEPVRRDFAKRSKRSKRK